jgi:hypothetical protein
VWLHVSIWRNQNPRKTWNTLEAELLVSGESRLFIDATRFLLASPPLPKPQEGRANQHRTLQKEGRGRGLRY